MSTSHQDQRTPAYPGKDTFDPAFKRPTKEVHTVAAPHIRREA